MVLAAIISKLDFQLCLFLPDRLNIFEVCSVLFNSIAGFKANSITNFIASNGQGVQHQAIIEYEHFYYSVVINTVQWWMLPRSETEIGH